MADELDDATTVSAHRRRHLPRPRQTAQVSRADLKDLLVAQGLYPHRIQFFVEGVTEEIVLRKLLQFLGYAVPGSGISVIEMGGVDQAQRHGLLFRSATEVADQAVLIADREGTLSKTLAQLQDEGLFTSEENLLLWSKDGRSVDFEEANFSHGEILTAIRRVARNRNAEVRLDLRVSELRAERTALTKPGRNPPALTKLALAMAEDRGARVSKRELAHVLADRLIEDVKRSGHLASAGADRPLLRHLGRWIASMR